MTAPHQTPILECEGCGHGWHALACDTYVAAGGVAVTCRCLNSAPGVPTPAAYLAGARNPVSEALRTQAQDAQVRHASGLR